MRENDNNQKKSFVYTYDAGGNLLTQKNGSVTEASHTWTQGRKLAKAVKNGVTSQYQYDHAGMRIKKTVGSTVTDYRYAGGLLISEKTGSVTSCYRYDSNANLIAVTIGGTLYFYVKNLQGDIIGLVNASGTKVVEYTYDNWGNLLNPEDIPEGSVGAKNPFRYRGYYYDTETGMYYLQSRYYDPEIRRFISADDVGVLFIQQGSLLQYNQYAYCFNNPVNYVDVAGYIPQAVEDKWVHDQVLEHICILYADFEWKKTCIYYNGKNAWDGWGFCDLYNENTGEVWELKKNSVTPSCTTENALVQLGKYINGRLKRKLDLELKLPYVTNIEGGYFDRKRNGYAYKISYWNEGNGILRYNYTKDKTKTRQFAEALATLIVFAVSLAVPGVSGGLVFA